LSLEFGNRHAGRLRDSEISGKINFQNGQIPFDFSGHVIC
jgi:hypothetical protein